MTTTVAAAAWLDPLPGDRLLLANIHHNSNGLGTKYALAGGDSWPRFGINGEPTSLAGMCFRPDWFPRRIVLAVETKPTFRHRAVPSLDHLTGTGGHLR